MQTSLPKLAFKTLYVVVVLLAWLWAISNAFAAISSSSNLGVVLGVSGLIVATFSAIWLIAIILKTRAKNAKASISGNTGGAGL